MSAIGNGREDVGVMDDRREYASTMDDGRDMSRLRERRRQARRRRGLLRLDVGLGVVGAIVLLLATPGLAIAALVALLLLVVCAVSLAWERRSARKRREASQGVPSEAEAALELLEREMASSRAARRRRRRA